jgi:hypothetical protein
MFPRLEIDTPARLRRPWRSLASASGVASATPNSCFERLTN